MTSKHKVAALSECSLVHFFWCSHAAYRMGLQAFLKTGNISVQWWSGEPLSCVWHQWWTRCLTHTHPAPLTYWSGAHRLWLSQHSNRTTLQTCNSLVLAERTPTLMSWFPFYFGFCLSECQLARSQAQGPTTVVATLAQLLTSLCQNDIQMVTSNRTRRHNQTAYCWHSSPVGRPVSDTSVDAVLPSNAMIHFSKQFPYLNISAIAFTAASVQT